MKKYIFKKSPFAFIDMLKAKHLPNKVLDKIELEKNINIKTNYHVNNLTRQLHPKFIKVNIVKKDYLKDNYIKFRFESSNKESMPFFRAGQYISLYVNYDGVQINRPYSISSSPYEALYQGYYEIIIKITKDGLISNYLNKNLNIGDELIIEGPFGEFYYDSLRDSNHVICITRGVGVTPFLSMAKAIVEGSEDFGLTILYNGFNIDCLIEYKILIELANKSNNKIKIVPILENTQNTNNAIKSSTITYDIIKKFYTDKSSIFVCGSKSLYKRIHDEIDKLKLPRKYIRYEKSNNIGKPTDYLNYININNKLTYKIVVHTKTNIITINGNYDDTILVSLQKAKITSKSNCLRGTCGWCRFKLIDGKVFSPILISEQRKSDFDSNIYYSCSSFPVSDLIIKIY